MDIIVMSREQAESLINLKERKSLFFISITDPHQKLANIDTENILRLSFYDIDKEIKVLSGETFLPMTDEDAQNIVNFINKNLNNIQYLVVHCEAGISRSSGVAAAISKHLTGSDEFFFKKYIPNRWCYNKVLEAFHNEK